jgi:hypothetical protein
LKKFCFNLFLLLISCFTANAQCPPATATVDLDIANVRARLMNGGDLWWDLVGNAKYEVPKGSGISSLFSGGIWFGGVDALSNLRLAAQTYRQSGHDFWPGPLDTLNATTTPTGCNQYDRFWKINRQEVLDFISGSSGPTVDMSSWPGNGDPAFNQSHFLAPFVDVNNDGLYRVVDGDYPKFDGIGGNFACENYLHGDQNIYWILNDAGNIHTSSSPSDQIGIEIHCQAFAYNSSNQDLANTTFYKYKLINRSTVTLEETYLGFWTDTDLGFFGDDYVGCDVSRSMAYAYNGDNDDESIWGYGLHPPAVGIKILSGPFADSGDSIDNNRNGVIDEANERIAMSKFVYFDNDLTTTGNPVTGQHFYNYLRGVWKDGTPMTYGGNGYNSGGPLCNFMFPDDSDPLHWGTNRVNPGFNWSELKPYPVGFPNEPADRRFIMSSGPFTMLPGAVNHVSYAVVWARDSAGGPYYSRASLYRAADMVQSLADNCFDLTTINIMETAFKSINIFPNPARKYLNIELPFTDGSPMNLKIFNWEGKQINSNTTYQDRVRQVDVSGLAPGIYFIRIVNTAGDISYSYKFVKQ